MSIDKIIVAIVSLLSIGFTFWFFLAKKEKEIEAGDSVDIAVEGGFSPEVISVKKDRVTQLKFFRTDPSSCLEEVVLGDFKIRKQLSLNETVVVEIKPEKSGEFTYTCGMGMYHGKIIVK